MRFILPKKLDVRNSADMSVKPNLNYWITLIDEKFREKNYQAARDFILQGLVNFPNHSILLDRLFIVDQR